MPSKKPAKKTASKKPVAKKVLAKPQVKTSQKVRFKLDYVLEFDNGIQCLPMVDINDLIAYGLADMDFVPDDGTVSILPGAKIAMTFVL